MWKLGIQVLGSAIAVCSLTYAARLHHFWQYGTYAEDWSLLYTVPAGLLFGPSLVGKLIAWTGWLEATRRWPGGSRGKWCALVPILFLGTLGAVFGLLFLLGRTVGPDFGYPILLGAWLLFVWLGGPPRLIDGEPIS